jgi:Tfp pilus assembly protein PilX
MTLILLVFVILLGAIALASLVVTADRISRATSWRQIALERRWNHEHHRP